MTNPIKTTTTEDLRHGCQVSTGYMGQVIASVGDCRTVSFGDNCFVVAGFCTTVSVGSGSVVSALSSSSVRGGMGSVFVLKRFVGVDLTVRTAVVGGNGIKPNVFYRLNARGEFVEAEQ